MEFEATDIYSGGQSRMKVASAQETVILCTSLDIDAHDCDDSVALAYNGARDEHTTKLSDSEPWI